MWKLTSSTARVPRVTPLWYGSLHQVKWTLLPEFFEWGLADCLLYLGLMISRKPKFSQTNLPQYHFVYHKLYAEYFGTEPRLPSWKAGDWLSAFAIKVLIGQLSGTLIFLPQFQAKGPVICNDFEVNCFPILLSAILQPTALLFFTVTSRKFVYPRFLAGIEIKVDAGRCRLSSHRYFCKPSDTEKKMRKNFSIECSPISGEQCFLESSQSSPSALLVTATCGWTSMGHRWSDDWKKTAVLKRKTYSSATQPTTYLAWSCLGSNPDPPRWRPATNTMSYGTPPQTKFNPSYI